MNALCWNRSLDGDFKEIVVQLQLEENITEVSPEDLLSLQLSEQGSAARDIILNDLQLLTDFGASPSLNLLKCYERDDEFDFISTDVYSWHVDRSPVGTDTFYALIMAQQAILFQMIRLCKNSNSGSPGKAERII